jgi:glycosyltransferase involved in cell wall biosynthesis
MIRIASLPWYHPDNQYLRLYYGALEPFGFRLIPGLQINDRYLLDNHQTFDVIHVHWSHEELWRVRGKTVVGRIHGLLGLCRFYALAARLGKSMIWTAHDLQQLERTLWVDRVGNALLSRLADLCICHSEHARAELIRRYWGRPDTCIVMPHGNYDGVYPAPKPRTETLTKLGLVPAKRTLLACGLIRQYKGFDLAIDLMAELGDEYQLIVGGILADRDVADDLARRAAPLPNVKLLLRTLTSQEMADFHEAADCVLFPYRRITGSGALLTTLTLARGFVASDLPYFREYLGKQPEAGVLCAPDDLSALARAVARYFEVPAEARHAAARRIADRLRWADVIRPVAKRLHAIRGRAARKQQGTGRPCGSRGRASNGCWTGSADLYKRNNNTMLSFQ